MSRITFIGCSAAVAALLLSSSARSQQFQQQVGVLPAPVVWTEGVAAFDADGDGDLDIIFANGDGFSGAGTPRLPTLLINTGTSGGNPVFQDKTATQLPNITLNPKMVIAFDMDNDGDKDLLFSQAFNKPSKLYKNNGLGFFTDASTQIPGNNFDSYCACAGDIDNDGDPDLVVAHNNSTQLWRNDGAGNFTSITGNLPGVNKGSQQNVTFVDIDNDMDLDIIVDGKSTPQHVYFNNGSGVFTANTSLIPSATSAVYETDWADLDGDSDLDGFYISMSSFNEGTAKNNLIETGSLTFTGSTGTISGSNGFDDNEVAFIDYDDDGDLDVMIGSLGASAERLYRNNGNFTFTSVGPFSAQGDSTLDCTVGDFDGDGKYDAVTAQGESGNFTNRYYKNFGFVDTQLPKFVAFKVTSSDVNAGDPVVLAKVTDATMDDGVQFVECTVDWTVTPLAGAPVMGTTNMRYSGGSIYRAAIPTGLSADALLGATVSWVVNATDGAGNVAHSNAQVFKACGAVPYGVGAGGANVLTLGATGTPAIGGVINIDIANGASNAPGIMIIGVGKISAPFFGGTLLTNPVVVVGIGVGPAGSISFPAPVPNDAGLIGSGVNLQAVLADAGQAEGAAISNGLALVICAP